MTDNQTLALGAMPAFSGWARGEAPILTSFQDGGNLKGEALGM